MAYGQMLEEFNSTVPNAINRLVDYTRRLTAWASIIEPLSQEEKFFVTVEFIEPLAITALTLPYSIRSRFIFATAHLCHQANRSFRDKTWIDDLPSDDEIDFRTSDKYANRWKRYTTLKVSLERISDGSFHSRTNEFRHKYVHRVPPEIAVGLTGLVTRSHEGTTGSVSYGFGFAQPLSLSLIVEVLIGQVDRCHRAHAAFEDLVSDHIEAIKVASQP